MIERKSHPDLSFLTLDIRLSLALLAVVVVTLLQDQGFWLLCGAGFLLLAVWRWPALTSLVVVALILGAFQAGNMQLRQSSLYLNQQVGQWRVELLEESSLPGFFEGRASSVDKIAQSARVTLKLPARGFAVGQVIELEARPLASRFGIRLEHPRHIRLLGSEAKNDVKQQISAGLAERADPSLVGLFLGISYGDDRLISPEDTRHYRETGIAHLTAVSGSNIALVAGAAFCLGALALRRRAAALITAFCLTLAYCVLVGLEGSVVRALGFACLGFLAALRGSSRNLCALACSALLLMLYWNPLLLWEAGFVLSASMTLGLVLLCPALSFLVSSYLGELIARILSLHVVAQLVALPLTAAYFGKIYPYSFLANVVVTALVPLVLGLGVLYLLSALLFGEGFFVLFQCARPLLELIRWTAAELASWEGSVLTVHNSATLWLLFLLVGTLSCIIFYCGRRRALQTPQPDILIEA